MWNDPANFIGDNKKLTIYTIICCVYLYGGTFLSYLYWKNYVNDQFALFIIVTGAIYIIIEAIFVIPSIVFYKLLKNVKSMAVRFDDKESIKATTILSNIVLVSIPLCISFDLFLLRITWVMG